MPKIPDRIVNILVSVVKSLSKGTVTATKQTAYQNLKIKIAEGIGEDSDLFDAVNRLEKKPESAGVKLQVAEELSAIEIEEHLHIAEAIQQLIKAGDHIDIRSEGDVAIAKDQAVALIIKDITVQVGSDDPESLLNQYLQNLAVDTNYLPWANVDEDYADPTRGENLALVDIYTDLDTTTIEKIDSEDAVRSHLKHQREARRVSAQEMIDTHPKLVLLGDPGSGKSTLVNYFTHVMARADIGDTQKWLSLLRQHGPWSHDLILPIRIVLRDFATTIPDGTGIGRADLLRDYLESTIKPSGFRSILGKMLLDQKVSCLIFLDGLDEVPEIKRKVVVSSIDDFASRFSWHRFLVTCRIYAYIGQPYQLSGFQLTTLMPFSEDQIQRFIATWYDELHNRGRFSQNESKDRAEKLQRAALRNDLIGLAERPLLMTVMALLHTFRGGLPEDRVELYQWTIDLLLRRWESRHGGDKGLLETLDIPGLKMADLEAGFYAVAFDAHAGGSGGAESSDIREADLRGRLAPFLNHDWNKAGEFVNYVRDRAGLLIRHKPAAYTFPHRTFQEYMAACHLVGMSDYILESARMVRDEPDRWRIVYVLAAGYAARTHRLGPAISSVAALCSDGHCEKEGAGYAGYHLAAVAGEALLEIGLVGVRRESVGRDILKQIRFWLLESMQADAELAAADRIAAGNVLSRLGDPRFNPVNYYLPDDENLGFIDIPAGAFRMGSDKKIDKAALGRELPQHEVVLTGCAIARYPVTVAQYRVFAESTRHEMDDGWRAANRFDNHPVVEVTWKDAVAYCEWLNDTLNTGGHITLPTEAQWEKAARGNDGRIYPWGNTLDANKANYNDTGIGTTSPAGCFPGGESPYGILEMSGNVDEWCLDDRREYTEDTVTDPHEDGAYRVLRGGAWSGTAGDCRTAARSRCAPDDRGNVVGFRLVRLPGQPSEPGR